jgi:hypothetical protein
MNGKLINITIVKTRPPGKFSLTQMLRAYMNATKDLAIEVTNKQSFGSKV